MVGIKDHRHRFGGVIIKIAANRGIGIFKYSDHLSAYASEFIAVELDPEVGRAFGNKVPVRLLFPHQTGVKGIQFGIFLYYDTLFGIDQALIEIVSVVICKGQAFTAGEFVGPVFNRRFKKAIESS